MYGWRQGFGDNTAPRLCYVCRHICETPATEQAFIEQLHELHHKIDFAKEQSFKGALSVNDVGDVLDKLKVKVILGQNGLESQGRLFGNFV